MTKDQALKYFKTQKIVSMVCGVSPQAVSLWHERPPKEAQMRLHQASDGKLPVDRDVIEFYRKLTKGIL